MGFITFSGLTLALLVDTGCSLSHRRSSWWCWGKSNAAAGDSGPWGLVLWPCASLCVGAPVFMRLSFSVYLCMCICVCLLVSSSLSACASLSVSVYVSVYASVGICISVCVCAYRCVCVCVHPCAHLGSPALLEMMLSFAICLTLSFCQHTVNPPFMWLCFVQSGSGEL